MRTLRVSAAVLALMAMASWAAAEPQKMLVKPQLLSMEQVAMLAPGVPPAPGAGQSLVPTPAPGNGPAGVKLYGCTRVKDPNHIHPCAVPKVVKIVDPCYKPCKPQPCGCCRPCPPPPCVYVKICVPPCGCPQVKCSKDGRKVKYDYGQYRVRVESKNGQVTVNYDD